MEEFSEDNPDDDSFEDDDSKEDNSEEEDSSDYWFAAELFLFLKFLFLLVKF